MLYNQEDKEEFQIQIQELLNQKLIRRSNSPHSSPAFMVRNHSEIKRGKPRMVVNYKELNKNTKFDGYYLPNKEVLINIAKNKKYYSKFDCKSGFWQIKLEDNSIPLTAFSTPQGHYEWLVMPFGLKNAPQIYQRRMDEVFRTYNFLIVYVDDILVCSRTYEDHLKHLRIFATLCSKEGIILSQKKAEIAKNEIEFLGMIINSDGIKLQPHISEKIILFPDKLENKQQIQKFLGCLNYAEGFIEKLAEKRNKLQKLLRKSNKLGWNEEHTLCVKNLKENCKNLPKLRLPDEKDKLIVQTDASDLYWSALLKTDLNEICRYTSGTFNNAEVNYSTNEKELLAVVKGINKFKMFLLPKEFIVQTDNTQLNGLVNNKLPNSPQHRRLHRWQVLLSFYNFKFEYIKGKDNLFADFLSRNHEYGKD